ncbi:MAG: amidohydrolase family protein [Acidimicrobiia bacterium]|nr:amidohydrolase family protein [Acidimicrobiia bacterium]
MTEIAASHVLWPDGTLAPGVVQIDAGSIVGVGRPDGPVPRRILAPGFVDIQVNGHVDVDVATADGSDWDRLDDLLVAQGVTTWCPTVVTAPAASTAVSLGRIAVAARRDGARPAIAGAHMEGPFLGGRPGAHPVEHIAPPDRDRVECIPEIVRLVTLGPEADGATDAIARLRTRGITVALGHSTATYDEARVAVDAGATLVTHAFNAMDPLHHREPGLLGLALGDDRVAISLIADLVHVHPAALRIAVRSKPRGTVVLVTDAVAWRSGVLASRDIALVDGAPRLPDGTLAGSALTMDVAVSNLVGSGAADLASALCAASATPAALLGLVDRGTIATGRRADLVALDLDLRVDAVWIGGEQVRG